MGHVRVLGTWAITVSQAWFRGKMAHNSENKGRKRCNKGKEGHPPLEWNQFYIIQGETGGLSLLSRGLEHSKGVLALFREGKGG